MNLTDQQKDLLGILVSMQHSTDSLLFDLVLSQTGAKLSYANGVVIEVTNLESDFRQLEGEQLITLSGTAEGQLRGQPAQFGIGAVNSGFGPEVNEPPPTASEPRGDRHLNGALWLAIDKSPYHHYLLSSQMERRWKALIHKWESSLRGQLEAAESSLRWRRNAFETKERDRGSGELALQEMAATLRQQIVLVAQTAAGECVEEFATGLLDAQSQLARFYAVVRHYAARLGGEIRGLVKSAEIFQGEPRLPWRHDSVIQKAIEICERRLVENEPIDDVSSQSEYATGARIWPPVVLEWEDLKSRKGLVLQQERMSEFDMRLIISNAYGGEPEALTWEDIKRAAGELCRHYGRVYMTPAALESLSTERCEETLINGDVEFWKEREDEFRKFDTPSSALLLAEYLPTSGWMFSERALDYSTPKSLNVFLSLARIAANGLGGLRSAKPWEDWLNALLRAKDGRTGEFKYSKVSTTGSLSIGERELEHMKQVGRPIPQGGIVEFFIIDDESQVNSPQTTAIAISAAVGSGLYWDTTSEVIEGLFKASADYCLELRSLVGDSKDQNSSALEAAAAPSSAQTTARESEPRTTRSSVVKLNVERIAKWINEEGHTNKDLALLLKTSERTISSLRNDGNFHGQGAVTKLANLMKVEPEDLYLP